MQPKIVLEVDAVADSAYIRLSDSKVRKTVELTEDVLIDLDEFNVVVGVEVLTLHADIPFDRIEVEHHVHSTVVEALKRIRPSVGSFLNLQTGTDGTSAMTDKTVGQWKSHTAETKPLVSH